MTCLADELILLDEGGLTEARARQVRDHIQNCQSCAAALAKQHSLVRRLSESLAGVGPPNVDAVLRRINSTERPKASNLPRRISLGLAALAASAAMAVLWSRQPALVPAEFVARGPAAQSWASRVGVTHHLLPSGGRGEGEHAILDGSIVSVHSGWMTSYRSSALQPVFLLSFLVDSTGAVQWLQPVYESPGEDPEAVRLNLSPRETALPDSVALGLAPGKAQLFTVLLRQAAHVSDVEQLSQPPTSAAILTRFPDAHVSVKSIVVEP